MQSCFWLATSPKASILEYMHHISALGDKADLTGYITKRSSLSESMGSYSFGLLLASGLGSELSQLLLWPLH